MASDIPAVREVLEEGGNATLVPPAQSGALADALAALLDDPARLRACAARSRQRFEEQFTLAESIDRMVDLYRRLVAQRDGRPRVVGDQS